MQRRRIEPQLNIDDAIGSYASHNGVAINHGRKRQSIKPPVPLQSELPLEKERIPEDFLKKNVSLVREVTRRPTPTPSPEPLKKHGYGQVPKYLTSMKRQMEAKKSAQEEEMKAQESRSETGVRLLPEEDRLSILKKLQEEWQMRNQEFQRFSFVVDTEMKRKRREDLLRKLQVLEKDIQTMSKPNIYVLAEEAGTMSHEAYVMY